MIIYRFEKNCKGLICDFVKLFLQNGKIVLISQIADCTLTLIHETKMEVRNNFLYIHLFDFKFLFQNLFQIHCSLDWTMACSINCNIWNAWYITY